MTIQTTVIVLVGAVVLATIIVLYERYKESKRQRQIKEAEEEQLPGIIKPLNKAVEEEAQRARFRKEYYEEMKRREQE